MIRWLCFLSFSGCLLTPLKLSPLIDEARQNEIRAVASARDRRVAVQGLVADIGFQGSEESETVTRGVSVPVGTASVTRQKTKTLTHVRKVPYVDLRSDEGIEVRCWFADSEDASPFANGMRASVVGWFRELERTDGTFKLYLGSCKWGAPTAK